MLYHQYIAEDISRFDYGQIDPLPEAHNTTSPKNCSSYAGAVPPDFLWRMVAFAFKVGHLPD